MPQLTRFTCPDGWTDGREKLVSSWYRRKFQEISCPSVHPSVRYDGDESVFTLNQWFNEIFQNEKNSISVAGLELRTTSQVEALNSTIQRTFPNKPNIFNFIENLRLFDAIKSSDLYQLHLGTISNEKRKKKRLKDQQRDQKINLCTASLQKEEINVLEFLQLMANENLVIGTPSDGTNRITNK